ncbi:MAG: hypothetical protein RR282_04080 [Acinetobacter sp.]|mgnify:FL=1
MGNLKNRRKYIVIFTLGILFIAYYFLWLGQRDFYQLTDMDEVEKGCYRYQSDEGLKNIARHEIIRLYGKDALNEQRKLYIYHIPYTNEIGVGGRPYGFLKAFYLYFFANNYLTPLTVILVNNPESMCISIQSALYQKN